MAAEHQTRAQLVAAALLEAGACRVSRHSPSSRHLQHARPQLERAHVPLQQLFVSEPQRVAQSSEAGKLQ